MATTKIEWADYTWNPWFGCTKVSPACDHCYAEAWGRRTSRMVEWGGLRSRTSLHTRNDPRRWNRNARQAGRTATVFTLSLGDFFDNQVPTEWRAEAWNTIYDCKNLIWLILTKRPQNIAKMLPFSWGLGGFPNVWLGVTAENMDEARRRIPVLLEVPAAIHWISAEPLLSPLDLRPWLAPAGQHGVNWVIGGGETGGQERESSPDWFRDLRDQCRQHGAAYFMKQMTRRGAIPDDLMMRDFPTSATSPESFLL